MTVIGITGTNGKTPFPHWLAQAFSLLGHKAALLGTVGNGFIGQLTARHHHARPGDRAAQAGRSTAPRARRWWR